MGKTGLIGGAGAWMVAAALTLAASAWPGYIKPHPQFVLVFGVAGVVMLVVAAIQRVHPILTDTVPLAAKLHIQERLMRPSLDRIKRGIGDIFFLVDAELVDPKSAKVSYSLDLIRFGIAYSAEWAQDTEEWEVFDAKGANRGPACPLAVRLLRGQKVDGWLHFKVGSIGETELRECGIRLWVNSQRGSKYCEYPGNAWPIPRRDLTIKKKDTSTPLLKLSTTRWTRVRLQGRGTKLPFPCRRQT